VSETAPWASGSLELIGEAQVNLDRGDDVGRRIALILFDSAIETMTSIYLTLNPIQRGNRQYDSASVGAWLNNYHTRLDFIEHELAERDQGWEVSRAEIVWVHDCRNEQYHGGRKGTPEQGVIALARRTALWLYGLLFDVTDPEAALSQARSKRDGAPPPERDDEFDRLIDDDAGMIEIAGQLYYTSELLFAVDPAAYANAGEMLTSVAEWRAENDGSE
jgi:hypothetical protein